MDMFAWCIGHAMQFYRILNLSLKHQIQKAPIQKLFIYYLFNIRHNEVNATSLNEWLKYAFATNGKVLVIIFHAVNNAEPPLPIGGLAALEQRLDGDRVDEHPILGDHFLKQIELISYSFIELG